MGGPADAGGEGMKRMPPAAVNAAADAEVRRFTCLYGKNAKKITLAMRRKMKDEAVINAKGSEGVHPLPSEL
jgi:hypothetical protein